MTQNRYDSLREKLALPFVLLGFIVSSLLGLTSFALVANLEERAIARHLHVELESFRHRLSGNPAAQPVSSSLLNGYFLPSPGLPQVQLPPPKGEYLEISTIGDTDYSILSAYADGRPLALLYNRESVKSRLGDLALMLLIGCGAMTLLSLLVGMRLSRQVVRPITRLLEELSKKSRGFDPRGGPAAFSSADYPANEIGRLVREVDRFASRLYGFLQRESHFAADVSHELRTPVAVIRGAAEVLAEHPQLPDAIRQRLQTIHRQSVRMTELLDAMLLLAREDREGGDDEDASCRIDEVVRDAIADSQPSLNGRPVDLRSEISGRSTLPVERSLAYVVVSNLLRNACAHTPEGQITVRLDEHRLEVSDTGIGIPGDRFPTLFDRHSKGEESTGNGLGLSIVARVADRLGWKVSITSRSGAGTCVRVEFASTRNSA